VFDVLSSSSGDLAMDLTGKIKFGTADEDKGLGTGEQDYSLQADVFRFFDGATLMERRATRSAAIPELRARRHVVRFGRCVVCDV